MNKEKIHLGEKDEYKKSGLKPSDYCKRIFKNQNIKSVKDINMSVAKDTNINSQYFETPGFRQVFFVAPEP
jgi:hypothetical protein